MTSNDAVLTRREGAVGVMTFNRPEQLNTLNMPMMLAMEAALGVLEADPHGEHFFWINLHFSGYDRRKHDAGISHYLPVNLGEIPDYYRRFIDPPEPHVERVLADHGLPPITDSSLTNPCWFFRLQAP